MSRQPPVITSREREAFLEQCDVALVPYLIAPDDVTALQTLTRLHEEFIQPVAQSALARLMRRGVRRDRAEVRQLKREFDNLLPEVEGDVVLHLASLRAVLQASEGSGAPSSLPSPVSPIRSIEGYVAGVALHAHASRIRQLKPGRYRLEQRVRYGLTHTEGWALWRHRLEWESYDWWCGWDHWRELGVPVRPLPLPLALPPDLEGGGEVRTALRFLFDAIGGPVRFDDVLDWLAAAWNVEVPFQTVPLEEAAGSLPSAARPPAGDLEALLDYWRQILRLSPRQRAALLLRTDPEQGEALLFLFVDHQVATLKEAAAAVGIATQQLQAARLGPPLTDEKIGALLGITAPQVRSYRQEARRRLQRVE
jgi:hypothetical protein